MGVVAQAHGGKPRVLAGSYLYLALAVAFLLSWGGWFALATDDVQAASFSPQGALPQTAADRTNTVPTADEIHLFVANLAGAHENPAVDTAASGRAVLSLISDTLTYRLFVSDIVSITASHIHDGPVGVNGGVVLPLYTGSGQFDPAHPISGTVTLTPVQIAKLMAGDYYVNVHTTAVPSGEIRGQLEPFSAPTSYNALLLGANEPNPVTTAAKGVAQFTLVNTNTLQYHVAVSDIISVTASHIHFGPVGVNGPVAHGLYTGTGLFDANNPVSGTVQLSANELVDLLTGYLYVNVHTSANPGGEIRGQIGGVRLFGANLTGAAETPPNPEIGSGRAVLALSADATTLTYRVTVQDVTDINASHIHRAPAEVAGPVVFPLFNNSGGGTFDAANPVSGTVAISIDQLMALIDDEYYVNVHTPAYPAGALRGQIRPMAAPAHLLALLRGDNETPSVETNAVGIARITLNETQGTLHYSVAVTDITDVTASHIHLAPTGQSGGVVFGLYNSSSGFPFDAAHPVAGAIVPAAKDWVDLLTGYHYVNVHSTSHPSGEIRGQIGAAQLFEARLSPTSEVPPVASNASGHAVMALNSTATALDYRVRVAGIADVTAAHIHRGRVGVSGGVVVPLFTG
ncbi:MAG TPA: CHRD domain-containing protein, partial [Caldilineaceae bacterium]|nr:CHRD domain-containing protein [Caldilineaceae bacterium]